MYGDHLLTNNSNGLGGYQTLSAKPTDGKPIPVERPTTTEPDIYRHSARPGFLCQFNIGRGNDRLPIESAKIADASGSSG